ncbi:MAG: methylenetetrahydrofolate--tRNA-(uracil(54)-C(5))-methyltransferase (FADH(2)-oxidizing) TrmFO [Planctomycetota bacterium]|nr:methylenetetrahydrofolate--tRNA-(uracil(54)-C(5))-methyltransferase (FADH(2)-oxidizing) TrmFO [Planctomycetota bacterium]MDP6940445.1 methylenetetrahydrofolate--tRNA-(uracil(54)-C(5))-methyltransferase (FADH(2)-oxidizing) TrmFO [Planctomycetota bacterium]
MDSIPVIGAGLAGSEAAWQIAEAGLDVRLYEMRPHQPTPAHQSDHCAELVCSNSLGSTLPDRAAGVLQTELASMDSMLLLEAQKASVPAGQALAVDRDAFGKAVTKHLEEHPRIQIIREEVNKIPEDSIIVLATGPLTSESMAHSIQSWAGTENLSFFDAIAPVVTGDSLDLEVIFRASRWQAKEEDGISGDYLNIPLDKDDYENLLDGLLTAEKHELKEFEEQDPRAESFFERCLPVEILASRGRDSLRYGPLRPVGLFVPKTGKRPYAVVQLRAENKEGTLWNLVGFQTNLRYGEQEALLHALPGMKNAEFVRLGSMHRNTFICSPKLLTSSLEWKTRPGLFIAGQLSGIEGYLGNIGSGLLAGRNAIRKALGEPLETLPPETLLGALALHISEAPAKGFQPMKAEFGILPPLPRGIRKNERRKVRAQRSQSALASHLLANPLPHPERHPEKSCSQAPTK